MTNTLLDLQIAVDDASLPSEADLLKWVDVVLTHHQLEQQELTIRIVEPSESQALNHDYRDKDKPTNVLSFPFEAPPEVKLPLLGDLVICAQVVEQEAQQQQKPLLHHWAHMVVHGTLHLLGYDHISEQEAEEMETLEIQLLTRLHIKNPYLMG